MYDLIIVGAGPAGLAAAIYAARAELKFFVLEKEIMSGGQIINTYEVDNYPGLYHMGGFDLAMKFREHADALGASFVTGEVEKIEETSDGKKIICKDGTEYETKTVILSGGAKHRKLQGLKKQHQQNGNTGIQKFRTVTTIVKIHTKHQHLKTGP